MHAHLHLSYTAVNLGNLLQSLTQETKKLQIEASQRCGRQKLSHHQYVLVQAMLNSS